MFRGRNCLTVRWALDHYRQTAARPPYRLAILMEPTIHTLMQRLTGADPATLEAVAERHGDPTTAIYANFSLGIRTRKAVLLDRDGSVRAAMVQQGLECIMDQVEEGRTAATIMADERSRHDGYVCRRNASTPSWPR
jgi:hypothetical protein